MKQRKFYRLVEIENPPTREELEKAGESVIEFEIDDGISRAAVDESEGGTRIAGHRLEIYHRSGFFTPDSPACKNHGAKVEIYGDAYFLSELLITAMADKLRFVAPFPWHFDDAKNALRRFGVNPSKYYLSERDKESIARWFPDFGKALLEKEAALDGFLAAACHFDEKSADGDRA